MARKFRKPPHDEPKPSGIGSNKGGQNEYGDLIKFSFKYLNLTHNKFHYSDREAIYFMKLIERMQNLSTFKALEAKTSLSKVA